MSTKIADRMARAYQSPPTEGFRKTEIPDLYLMKVVRPAPARVNLFHPCICITIRGSKTAVLGEEQHTYPEGTALMIGLDLPVWGQVTSPSAAEPYLGIVIELKSALLRQVAIEVGVTAPAQGTGSVLNVVTMSPGMTACLERMLDLLDVPSTVPHLWPLLLRELVVRLLTGPQASEIVRFAGLGTPASGIPEAIAEIRSRFRESISIAELARRSNMSVSSFHRHFLAVARITPLQYQKQLRLIEARRLLEEESEGVASAAYQVGYESPSQFSRDFARFFRSAPRDTLKALAV